MIDPLKFYSITDLLDLSKEGYFPVKSRTSIIKLIESGKLRSSEVGVGEKPVYMIKGEDVLIFLDTHGSLKVHQRHDS